MCVCGARAHIHRVELQQPRRCRHSSASECVSVRIALKDKLPGNSAVIRVNLNETALRSGQFVLVEV